MNRKAFTEFATTGISLLSFLTLLVLPLNAMGISDLDAVPRLGVGGIILLVLLVGGVLVVTIRKRG